MTPVTPTTLSPTYAANFGPTQTTVYSGALPLSSAVTGPAGGPKDFDIVINLQTPFFYNPAQGNLLIEVKNFVGVRTVQFDAVSSVAVTNRVYNEDNNPNGAVGILNPGLVAGLVTQFIFGNVLDGTYQLRYFANLDKGDSYVNLSNAGTLAGFAPAGNIVSTSIRLIRPKS